MSRTARQTSKPRRRDPFDPDGFFMAIDLFFAGKGPVHQTMRRVVRLLDKARIPYVIIGGMALQVHGYERMTKDVDVLLTRPGFDEFRRLYVPKYFEPVPGFSRRFVDRKNQRGVDILLTGLYPGRGKPGPIAFPDPERVRQQIKSVQYLELVPLIELKLAARRHRDFADVVELIRYNNLDESFLDRLHQSVRQDFIECLEEKRREDEYQLRNG